MEKITLIKNDDDLLLDVSPNLEYGAGISLIMNGLALIAKKYVSEMEKSASDVHMLHEAMYDKFDALFAKLLKDIFPDIKTREFDLLTAAIVKAQDDIINMAEAEGMTYDEALDKYNQISNDYIAKKRVN